MEAGSWIRLGSAHASVSQPASQPSTSHPPVIQLVRKPSHQSSKQPFNQSVCCFGLVPYKTGLIEVGCLLQHAWHLIERKGRLARCQLITEKVVFLFLHASLLFSVSLFQAFSLFLSISFFCLSDCPPPSSCSLHQ